MNKLIKALAACLITATGALTTQVSADQCWDSCCDWAVGLEFLYWRPCVCDFEYATVTRLENSNDQTTRQPAVVKPSNHPGWRLFASRYCDNACTFGTIEWLHIRSTDNSQTNSPLNNGLGVSFPPQFSDGNASSAIGQLRAIYNKINVRVGQVLHRGCNLEFYGYAGARLLDINLYKRTELFRNNNPAIPDAQANLVWRTKASFSGVGVELGIGAEYRLECCLGIAARLGATAAVGDQKFSSKVTAVNQGETNNAADIFYRKQTRCVPGLDARLGLNYLTECECFSALFELGYAVEYYYDAVVGVRGNNTMATSCDPFGFAGPYLTLRLEY